MVENENQNVSENGTTPETPTNGNQTEQNGKIEFNEAQQLKLNSLIKDEKAKILSKLGVSTLDEALNLVNEGKKSGEYQEKIKNLESVNEKVSELTIENALITNNIADDMKDTVKYYFKGAGVDLNSANLKDLLAKNEKLASQWTNKPVAQPVKFGDPQGKTVKSDDGYAEFKRKAGLKW